MKLRWRKSGRYAHTLSGSAAEDGPRLFTISPAFTGGGYQMRSTLPSWAEQEARWHADTEAELQQRAERLLNGWIRKALGVDPQLLAVAQATQSSPDIHMAVARAMFGPDPTEEQRELAKRALLDQLRGADAAE